MNRNSFIKSSLGLGALAILPRELRAQKKEIFSLEEIQEFVFAAHKDFDATKKILLSNPLIIDCTNQFKKGDFETALGGACHMGRRDIADLLIEKGARLDMFCMTFLGYTDFVKDLVKKNPQYLNALGPHGFTLLHHASVGKQEAFADWLRNAGLTETRFENAF